MTGARYSHTATLLLNGKILVAGGSDNSGTLTSAELYDPVSGAWSPTGSLTQARENHSATLLPNGKVLVTGGYNSTSGDLASAEVYDPATGTWSITGSLTTARELHTATLLSTGQVLVTGDASEGRQRDGLVSRARSPGTDGPHELCSEPATPVIGMNVNLLEMDVARLENFDMSKADGPVTEQGHPKAAESLRRSQFFHARCFGQD